MKAVVAQFRGAAHRSYWRPGVAEEIAEALAPCRQPDGSYAIANEWHVVVARAE